MWPGPGRRRLLYDRWHWFFSSTHLKDNKEKMLIKQFSECLNFSTDLTEIHVIFYKKWACNDWIKAFILIKSNEYLNSPPMLFYWERWRIFAYKRDKFFFLFDKGRVGGILFETVNFWGETSFSSAPNIFSMGSTRFYFRVSKRCV